MFGEMNVTPIVDLCHSPDKVSASVNEAISRLLEVTDYPNIAKWVQFPKALFVFLVVPADPESGAFYIYDRAVRGFGSGWILTTRNSAAIRSAISTAWYVSADSWTSWSILNCSQAKNAGSSSRVFGRSGAASLRKERRRSPLKAKRPFPCPVLSVVIQTSAKT